ncbi:GspH/FimT family pseudopilin [Marinobacter xestospongiae]|uniref:Type II secretion system protein H n=1 Tax=Marinobacter xestospongiae TaxID=994319 RepID=A0ABU3W2Y2_9GAMM|nr:GspH/FimT family pseudopilin [Marinobacter xestospongiae]MDV2080894.1 GspH/FimT family pseudopilin [Marinobacter xestospongiae]
MRGNRMRGFTLVELMISVAVAAVLLSIAVPSFRELMARNELVTVTNAWVGALNTARAEAVKRNQPVALCGKDDAPTNGIGSNCDASLAGQIRYLPRNGGSAEALHPALKDSVTKPLAIAASTTVRFRGDGIGYRKDNVTTPYNTTSGGDPAVVVLCSSAFSLDNARRIELLAGSTVQVVTETRASCP